MDWWWTAPALVLSFALAAALHRTLDVPALQRTNYRGRVLPTGGGIAAVFAFTIVCGVFVLSHPRDGVVSAPLVELIVIAGYGVVGFFDDVVGTHSARGLRGHVTAGARGQLTSGATKLIVGVALAAAIAPFFSADSVRKLLVVIVIAGAANAANLFDLAPARAAKVAAIALAAVTVAAGARQAVQGGPAWFFACVVGLLPFELRERLMLGDAGANALGAIVGIAAVRACGDHTVSLAIAAAVVLAINVAGEFVSFSAVIDRTPVLRALDRLGRVK
jgi:UDP-N-acetylmuramyl pentapeptide phosphotransferase/UDP-N-acetylglucosamine-1-phosphate transferase